MSFLPEAKMDFKEFYDGIYQSVRGRVLITALELKVFDELSQAKTASQVGAALDLPAQRCQALLDHMAACGFIQKLAQETFVNNARGEHFLATGGPAYIGDLIVETWNMIVDPLNDLTRIMKHGFPDDSQENLGKEELWAHLAHVNAQYARAGMARMAAEQISALPEFAGFQKMLDMGGGPGLVAMAVVEAHPTLIGVVLDQPAVVKVAQEYIDQYGFSDRVTVLGADYSSDDIGQGYDLVWASLTLNFHHDKLDFILGKIHQALNPGGVLACLQDGLTHYRTQPREMVMNFLAPALQGTKMGFAQGEIAEAMLAAGFSSVRSRTLETSCGPLDLDLARKAR
jgi:predicted O-methyltransferase YrrM